MRVIIAGGRAYEFTYNDYALLDTLSTRIPFTEVVTGGAKGADEHGKKWAIARGIKHREIIAEWGKYGRAAGPRRNLEMVWYAGPNAMLIAFPGGRGTANVTKIAREHGLYVIEVPPEPVKPKPNPAARWRRKLPHERTQGESH